MMTNTEKAAAIAQTTQVADTAQTTPATETATAAPNTPVAETEPVKEPVTLETIEKLHAQHIAEANAAIRADSATNYAKAMAKVADDEKDYKKMYSDTLYDTVATAHDLIVMHTFKTLSHTQEKKNGVSTILKSEKSVQVDLLKFCEHRKIDMGWWYEAQSLNKRLTLRKATELGMTPEEVKKIDDSFSMNALAEAIKLKDETPNAPDPLSDKQCVKHLQRVFDKLSPGEGHLTKYDLAYVLAGYTRIGGKDPNRLLVQCANHKQFLKLLTTAFYKILENKKYGVAYKEKK